MQESKRGRLIMGARLDRTECAPWSRGETWAQEAWHKDEYFDRDPRQKTKRGRSRLANRYVAALHRIDEKPVRFVANTIATCRPGSRCGSGACPQCGRAYARWVAEKAEVATSGSDMVFVTIIPAAENPIQHVSAISA